MKLPDKMLNPCEFINVKTFKTICDDILSMRNLSRCSISKDNGNLKVALKKQVI